MDNKILELFSRWPSYMQKASELYGRLGSLFRNLGIKNEDIRIIIFISSSLHGEIKFFDYSGNSGSSPQYVNIRDVFIAESHILELFDLKREQTIFSFGNVRNDAAVYDEFGVVPWENEEICYYGVVLQFNQLKSSKLILELFTQISVYSRQVLDDESFMIEEYMLANLVYTALKKQIDLELFNTLAASSYEKRIPSGGILFIDETMPYDLQICFEEKYPLDINNVKQIRKLLEMTTSELYLISWHGNIIGLGSYVRDSDLLHFNGHQFWSYYSSGKELLIYKEGKYTFIFDQHKDYISYFPKNFINKNNSKYINVILHETKQQKHGALLIISDSARAEVERLCKLRRGYAIKPVDLKLAGHRNILSSITSIDGAIFIDTNFFCYGIGVILDGLAVKSGLSSRGARYNSAKCYIDNKDNEKFVAVVVSEDETIDIMYNKEHLDH